MRCFWCHNPEGRRPRPELRYVAERCINCGACVIACPSHAHELIDGIHVFHRNLCNVNGACVDTCYSGALELNGKKMTVEEVLDEIRRDKPFYDTSRGGVTLSGGEPTLDSTFARQILERCKDEGIHTAIETCGDCPWESFTSLLPVTDLVMMDLKLFDIDAHREATGRPNNRILDNAYRLAKTDKPLVFRTPVVPSVNDSEEEIGRLASFIRGLMDIRRSNGHVQTDTMGISYELLAFHGLAADKYATLGMTYDASQVSPPSKEKMTLLVNAARNRGVHVGYR